jgi:hypothetical protein
MDLNIETVIGFLVTFGAIIWKFSELKRNLERDFDDRVDSLKEAVMETQTKLDLISQKFDNAILTEGQRLTNLHNYSKSKIKDVQYQFNEIVGYLEKMNPDKKFIIRSRMMSRDTMAGDEESWTQITKKS